MLTWPRQQVQNSFVFGLISPHVGIGFEMHAPMLEKQTRNERARMWSPLFIVTAWWKEKNKRIYK